MSKIVEVCCYRGALEKINLELRSRFPIYLRSIASSRSGEITLKEFTEAGNDAMVRSIEEIVANGTELLLDAGDVPIDRPEDKIEQGIVTRVAPYSGRNNLYLMFIPNALQNLARYAAQNLSSEEQRRLALTVLAYDSTQVQDLGGVKIALPHDRKLRRRALIRAYLLNQFSCSSEK